MKWRFILLLVSSIISTFFWNSCSKEKADQPITKPRKLDQVSLQIQWVTQAQFAGYYVALDKGWYRDEQIKLTIKPGGPDLVPVDLVAAGSSDFGTTLLADLCVAIHKGKKVISIAQIQQSNGLLLIAKKTSNIKTPTDFIGKKIGVWLGGWEVQFFSLLAQANISPQNVKVISQGWSMTPFINGDIDVASVMIYNEYHMVLAKGISPDELNIIDYADYHLDFPGDVLFTSHEHMKKNPDLCVRMIRASLKGWKYAINHPEEAADIVLKYDESGIQTKNHQLAMMKEMAKLVQISEKKIGHIENQTIEQMISRLKKYNIIQGELSANTVFTDALLNKARQTPLLHKKHAELDEKDIESGNKE